MDIKCDNCEKEPRFSLRYQFEGKKEEQKYYIVQAQRFIHEDGMTTFKGKGGDVFSIPTRFILVIEKI